MTSEELRVQLKIYGVTMEGTKDQLKAQLLREAFPVHNWAETKGHSVHVALQEQRCLRPRLRKSGRFQKYGSSSHSRQSQHTKLNKKNQVVEIRKKDRHIALSNSKDVQDDQQSQNTQLVCTGQNSPLQPKTLFAIQKCTLSRVIIKKRKIA